MGCQHELRPITQAQAINTSLHRPGAEGGSTLQKAAY